MIKNARDRVMLTKLNMTPMIDCVFLLNLFFMVVTELTRQDDIEALKLPDIRYAQPDENPDPERLVVNILKDGTVIISGTAVSEIELEDILQIEGRKSRNQEGISERIVLVKADDRTPFKYIKKIMMLCVKKNIRMWRLSFGIKPKELTGSGD